MNLAIIGSRGFDDYDGFCEIMDELKEEDPDLHTISGGADGADMAAQQWCAMNDVPITVIVPNWNKFGKSAGFIRNTEIWNNADAGIAFWDGESKGTAHSFQIAKRQGKNLVIINYTDGKIDQI